MLFDAAAGRAAVGSVSAGTAACVTAIRGEGSDSTDGTTLKGLATETGTISRRAAIPQSTSRQRFGAFARIRRSARITRISMLVGILIRMSRKNRSVMVFMLLSKVIDHLLHLVDFGRRQLLLSGKRGDKGGERPLKRLFHQLIQLGGLYVRL